VKKNFNPVELAFSTGLDFVSRLLDFVSRLLVFVSRLLVLISTGLNYLAY
jgi:hypothetical protein